MQVLLQSDHVKKTHESKEPHNIYFFTSLSKVFLFIVQACLCLLNYYLLTAYINRFPWNAYDKFPFYR